MKHSKSSPPEFPHGVTGENYAKKAEAFCVAREQVPFVISATYRKTGNEEFHATPRQWGAWMAYFHKIGGPWKSSERMGYCGVPAEWPHLFDGGAQIADDYVAADRYEARRPRPIAELSLAERKAVVKRAYAKYGGPMPNPPWCVKPEGYWNGKLYNDPTKRIWTQAERDNWDNENPIYPEGNRFPRDPSKPKTPEDHLKLKYQPESSAELRTPDKPISEELKQLIERQYAEQRGEQE